MALCRAELRPTGLQAGSWHQLLPKGSLYPGSSLAAVSSSAAEGRALREPAPSRSPPCPAAGGGRQPGVPGQTRAPSAAPATRAGPATAGEGSVRYSEPYPGKLSLADFLLPLPLLSLFCPLLILFLRQLSGFAISKNSKLGPEPFF